MKSDSADSDSDIEIAGECPNCGSDVRYEDWLPIADEAGVMGCPRCCRACVVDEVFPPLVDEGYSVAHVVSAGISTMSSKAISNLRNIMRTSYLAVIAALVTAGICLAGALGSHHRSTAAREHARALGEFQQHEARLALQASPARPVETPWGMRFSCVSASGWAYSSHSKDEADRLCEAASAKTTSAPKNTSGGGFPVIDLAAFNLGTTSTIGD